MGSTLICLIVVLSGCGDSGGSSNSSSKQLCDDVASLQSSVKALKDVDVVRNGVSSLQSALDDVKVSASKTADAARAHFAPQVDALESSLTSLGTALKDVQANGTAAVQQAAQDVEAANTDLHNAITSKECSS